jgi:hypothetical protein
MGALFDASRIATRGLLFAALLAATGGVANAQSVAVAPAASEARATLQGVVSATELAASQANLEALQQLAHEKPVHHLPDGGLTSAPSRNTIDSLPLTPEPNIRVFGGIGPSFASVRGFVGLFGAENAKVPGGETEPPDQGLAVNNNIAVEHINSLIQIFDATTGKPKILPLADTAFFRIPKGDDFTDTQVFFDPTTSRWFLDVIISNNATNTMDFALAISHTSNPLGRYFLYHIRAFSDKVPGCGGKDCFPDYPKAGYDAKGFYIGANLFSNISNNFVEAAIYALPKASLEAGAGFNYFRFDDRSDFVVQPSVPAPGEPFSTADNGSEFLMSTPVQGSTNLAVLAIINTNNIVSNGRSMKLLRKTLAVQPHGNGSTVPLTQPNVIGPFCKSRGVTSAPKLDGGFSAFQATIQKAGGNLYGALPLGAKDGTGFPRDVIAWFELHPSLTSVSVSASIVHQGLVVPPNGFSVSYPAFGLKRTGAGAMGMTIVNKTNVFPSAAFIQFTGSATTATITIPAGGKGVTSDDGFSGCPRAGPGQTGRWGDYGAATVDAKTGFLYTANEMIPNPTTFRRGKSTNWGTFITQLH